MAEQPPKKETELLDSLLKPLVERTEEWWAQMFSQVLGSEKFNEILGQTLKGQLLLQRAFQDQLDRYFKLLNLPSRGDLDAIVRELGELKAAVERLEARLEPTLSPPPRGAAGKRERAKRRAGGTG